MDYWDLTANTAGKVDVTVSGPKFIGEFCGVKFYEDPYCPDDEARVYVGGKLAAKITNLTPTGKGEG